MVPKIWWKFISPLKLFECPENGCTELSICEFSFFKYLYESSKFYTTFVVDYLIKFLLFCFYLFLDIVSQLQEVGALFKVWHDLIFYQFDYHGTASRKACHTLFL